MNIYLLILMKQANYYPFGVDKILVPMIDILKKRIKNILTNKNIYDIIIIENKERAAVAVR